MELASIIKASLEKKSACERHLFRTLDKSHCEETMKSFREKIITRLTTSPDTEKFFTISFPSPCGSYVKQLLDKEDIPNYVALHTNVNESNELFFYFDTEKYTTRIMMNKK